jgi:hypothetical protein
MSCKSIRTNEGRKHDCYIFYAFFLPIYDFDYNVISIKDDKYLLSYEESITLSLPYIAWVLLLEFIKHSHDGS